METAFDKDERGKAFFEETIRGIRQGAEFEWTEDKCSEVFTVFVRWPGRSVKLEVSRKALDQAVDDPGSRPRLAREIERQVRISESGGHGLVREV